MQLARPGVNLESIRKVPNFSSAGLEVATGLNLLVAAGEPCWKQVHGMRMPVNIIAESQLSTLAGPGTFAVSCASLPDFPLPIPLAILLTLLMQAPCTSIGSFCRYSRSDP
jgi:hypothetical protein